MVSVPNLPPVTDIPKALERIDPVLMIFSMVLLFWSFIPAAQVAELF